MVEENLLVALYRAALGRDPEPEAVDFWMSVEATHGLSAMMQGILFSDEALTRANKAAEAPPIFNPDERDLILKEIVLPENTRGWLALPAKSTDPIVVHYLSGGHENDYMLSALADLTSPGDCVLDLGAHVGTFCLPAAIMGRKVLAVDASRRHIDLIEISRRANQLQNLQIVHCAVADKDEPISFYEEGLFGRVDFAGDGNNTVTVEGRRVDGILEGHDFTKISMIKMDVEGSEMRALSTIRHLLDRDDGPAILFESNVETFQQSGFSVFQFRQWLQSIGYKVFRVEDEGWIYAPPDQIQPETWVDMLALKPRHIVAFDNRLMWDCPLFAKKAKYLRWASLPYEQTWQHAVASLEQEEELLRHYPDMKEEMTRARRGAP